MIDHPARTLAEVVAGLSSSRRAMTFVEPDGETRFTYREIGDITADLAARWPGLGVAPGDRVILVLPSKREFALAFLAAVRAGVVPVPVFPPERTGQLDLGTERLRAVSRHCRERLVLTSASLVGLCSETASRPVLTLADLAAAEPSPVTARTAPDDVAFLQYTSGSTGAPKGLAISHRNILANLTAAAAALELTSDDVGVSWLPLYHDMGLIGFLLTPVLMEADHWQLATSAFIQRPAIWMDWMTRTRATVSFGPSFAYELLAHRVRPRHLEGWDLSAWRVAGCGAEPVRPSVLRAFAAAMRPAGFDAGALTPAYGLAEATLMVTTSPVGSGVRSVVVDPDALARDGRIRLVDPGPHEVAGMEGARGVEMVSCGPPIGGTEVRIDQDGDGPGRQGEVCVRGASVVSGYRDDAASTEAAFVDGWLRTGDLGFLRDGELYVTGRIKDLVIRNGSNYHPQDIERAFCLGSGLRPTHVVAISGAEEELVVLVEGRTAAADGVFAGSRQVLAAVGVGPDRVVFVPRGAIPRTSSGKLRRQELRRRFLAGELEMLEAAGSAGDGAGEAS
jgi:fatty-acyl-CoA synthase